MKRHVQLVIVVCSALAMLGCMTVQPLTAERTQLSQTLKPGDRVEIVTNDGQKAQFKVETVDESGVHGAGQHIAYGDIQSISRKQVAVGRTALIVLGIAAIAALAAGGGGGGGSGY